MNEKEFLEIYNNLLDLTKLRTLTWSDDASDAGENVFEVSFPRSSVSVYMTHDNFGNPAGPAMSVYNAEGFPIATSDFDFKESVKTKYFETDVTELYNLLQAQKYKYSETARDILGELKKLRRNE